MRLINKKIWIVISIIVCFCLYSKAFAKQPERLLYPTLVDSFYHLTNKNHFWITSADSYLTARRGLLAILDSTEYHGLNKYKYHYAAITNDTIISSQSELMSNDSIFTDAIIAISKDVYQGAGISEWILSDEISGKYSLADNDFLLNRLSKVNSISELYQFFTDLAPKDAAYSALQQCFKQQLPGIKNNIKDQLKSCLNLYRWIHHFHFDKFIVVNIPSATLRCYMQDSILFQMKVVTGKPSTRTPRFSSYCNEIILYPYWNVPKSIALKELLPRFKKSLTAIDELNMQVIDGDGKILDPYKLNWEHYNRNNFPYKFRQSTGCDNSLGVIKFNLTNPFSVYMHDTNFKKAFESKSRYISHGCIRVQNPIELGDYLSDSKLDTNLIMACVKGQNPITQKLKKTVPVFVVYMTAEADSTNHVIIYKDVYHLYK